MTDTISQKPAVEAHRILSNMSSMADDPAPGPSVILCEKSLQAFADLIIKNYNEQLKAPTVPDNMQDWAGMDGTITFHLIERHADNWSDVGKMMSEWLEANSAAQIGAKA